MFKVPGRKILVLAIIILASIMNASCQLQAELPDPLEAGWEGKAVCELLYEDSKLRVLRCTFEPGIGHEPHFHAPHFGYTLNGGLMRMTDSTGTSEINVPSDSIFNKAGVSSHHVLNIGETTARFLIIEAK